MSSASAAATTVAPAVRRTPAARLGQRHVRADDVPRAAAQRPRHDACEAHPHRVHREQVPVDEAVGLQVEDADGGGEHADRHRGERRELVTRAAPRGEGEGEHERHEEQRDRGVGEPAEHGVGTVTGGPRGPEGQVAEDRLPRGVVGDGRVLGGLHPPPDRRRVAGRAVLREVGQRRGHHHQEHAERGQEGPPEQAPPGAAVLAHQGERQTHDGDGREADDGGGVADVRAHAPRRQTRGEGQVPAAAERGLPHRDHQDDGGHEAEVGVPGDRQVTGLVGAGEHGDAREQEEAQAEHPPAGGEPHEQADEHRVEPHRGRELRRRPVAEQLVRRPHQCVDEWERVVVGPGARVGPEEGPVGEGVADDDLGDRVVADGVPRGGQQRRAGGEQHHGGGERGEGLEPPARAPDLLRPFRLGGRGGLVGRGGRSVGTGGCDLRGGGAGHLSSRARGSARGRRAPV